ncbi:MAG: hypothetical protein JOZ25_10725 [Actinobacteria bacterium]|nr:hypothetical protein [Actinomycetota bacterium]
MSHERPVLEEVIAAADPHLRPYARAAPRSDDLDLTLPNPDRAFTLAAVREGYLLHHGEPLAFEGMDDDLRLLAGDALYALGLERVAVRGDLEAIAELSDLISLCAWAHAEGRADVVPGVWSSTVAALSGDGGGASSAIPL